MLSSSAFASKESENNWRNYMMQTYKTPPGTELSCPTIFQPPKRLKDTKPEAYHPRILGLGPFHHCRLDLPEKMLAIKRSALHEERVEFEGTMEFMKRLSEPAFEEIMQSCYSSCFDLDWETLMLIMIVDSACLLAYLFVLMEYVPQSEEEEEENRLIISDRMMLENQIPYDLVQRVFQYANKKGGESFKKDYVFCLFYALIEEASSVRLADDDDDYQHEKFLRRPPKHLLHCMYNCVVGRKVPVVSEHGKSVPGSAGEISPEAAAAAAGEPAGSNILQQTRDSLKYAGRQAKDLFQSVIGEINSATSAAKAKRLKVPEWFDNAVQGLAKQVNFSEKEPDGALDKVHSVTELYDIIPKITFRALPKGSGFGSIRFDKDHRVVSLPIMTLNSHSEVILRNLLAFEAEYVDSTKNIYQELGIMCV